MPVISPTGAFRPEDFKVDADMEKASMLPPLVYSDPVFFKRELATIFKQTWALVPPNPGETRSFPEILGKRDSFVPFFSNRFFLSRDASGRLHCFFNRCTHARYPLVQRAGSGHFLECGQHGRKYTTDGMFHSHDGLEDKLSEKEKENLQLVEINLSPWNQFLFFNLATPIAPLWNFIKDMHESVALLPLIHLRHVPLPDGIVRFPRNWKLDVLNYLDSRHITYIHGGEGGLAQALDMTSYHTELYPYSILQWAYAQKKESGFDPDFLPERFRDEKRRVFALWWFIFPNMAFNFYPWGLSINLFLPDTPETTILHRYHYVWDDEKYARKDELWLDNRVNAEDIEALNEVAAHITDPATERSLFLSQEQGPHWFHRLVSKFVF